MLQEKGGTNTAGGGGGAGKKAMQRDLDERSFSAVVRTKEGWEQGGGEQGEGVETVEITGEFALKHS